MNKSIIDKIFSTFFIQNEHPKTELNFLNDFTLLIAIVLSAQSTDVAVNKATNELFKIVKSPYDLLKLGEENLKKYISSIGLYNSKAKNLIKLADQIIKLNGIPKDLITLKTLAGVGDKTARVFLNCFYHFPIIAVDTHVFRVSKRIGLAHSNNTQKVTEELEQAIPLKWKKDAHHWLILHGRYICKARKPLCEQCPINQYCEFFKNNY